MTEVRFNQTEFVNYLESLAASTRLKYENTIELFIDTCNSVEPSLDESQPSSAAHFLQSFHDEGYKTSTIRVFNSILEQYFYFGYNIKLYEKCPTIRRKLDNWEKRIILKRQR